MFGDMKKMMKEAKDLQKKMKAAEKELEKTEVEGSSKNGKILCRMTGKMNLTEIEMDPEFLSSAKASEIKKATEEAVRNALDEAQKAASSAYSGMAGGMNIPGLM